MVAAGFSGGEAEELRRAMGFKRSSERMAVIEGRLRAGMTGRGIVGETQGPKHLPRPSPAVVTPSLAVRLGMRNVRDLRASTADALEDDVASPFPEMSRFEETASDYQTTEMTAGPHLIAHFRPQLKKDGTLSIRTERFERMSLEEPISELHRTASPPDRHQRHSTPPSHDFR